MSYHDPFHNNDEDRKRRERKRIANKILKIIGSIFVSFLIIIDEPPMFYIIFPILVISIIYYCYCE
jgi:uncharacterized membrane protein